jgi:putative SOS response-associated peptidase YedK
MCKRYICAQKISIIEKRFNLDDSVVNNYKSSYNISKGNLAPVITNEHPKLLQFFNFGMTPFFAKEKLSLLNARVEGSRNRDNDPYYTGAKAIIHEKAFQKQIRSQRCLVIADAFIVGIDGSAQPHVVYLKDKIRPFAFAGLWDVWKDEGGKELYSFSIITTVANQLLTKLGQERQPVILQRNRELAWLNNNLPLADAIRYLYPYPAHLMNAYPVANTIKDPNAEGRHLIEPIVPAKEKVSVPKAVVDFGQYGGWKLNVN